MKNLIIIGARGAGREIYGFRNEFKGYKTDYTIKGFLDDKANALADFPGYPPILSSVEDYQICEGDVFVCALGDPIYKEKYVNIIKKKGGEFISLIPYDMLLSADLVHIGVGCIIYPKVGIACNTYIGDFTIIQPQCLIGHDSVIGDYSMMHSYSFTGGGAVLGKAVHLFTGTQIMPHVKIGDNSTVNANSVVTRDVEPNSTVWGIPAQKSTSWYRMILKYIK